MNHPICSIPPSLLPTQTQRPIRQTLAEQTSITITFPLKAPPSGGDKHSPADGWAVGVGVPSQLYRLTQLNQLLNGLIFILYHASEKD
jgi:hypothetical protein